MKHTFTVALSLNAIKQEISAQCAWIDATNLTTLPPIVNPIKHIDMDSIAIDEISLICNRLSGYLVSRRQEGDLYVMEMGLEKLSGEKLSLLTKSIEKRIVNGIMVRLYSTQKQVSHIVELYRNICGSEMRRILQLFAYTD